MVYMTRTHGFYSIYTNIQFGGIAADGVLSQNFTHWPAETCDIDCWAQLSQDTLNRAIDQLPKRLMMVIKANDAHAEFRLD